MNKMNEINEVNILFTSRTLLLLWLPPIYHSPCLYSLPGRGDSWFWRCDLHTLSWINGMVKGQTLPPDKQARVDFVRSYVCATHNITDENRATAMPPSGAKLNVSLPLASVGLCDAYCGPSWSGIIDAAESAGHFAEDGSTHLRRTEVFKPQEHRRMLEFSQKKKRK